TDPSSADVAAGFHYAFAVDAASLSGVTYASSGTSASQTFSFGDGPSDHTITVRIIDKDGGYNNYTHAVHLDNVAPAVTLASSVPGTTESGVGFGATVSDPSPADTAAGFTYSWNFGDGTTSSQNTPSHTYAATGTYSVAVTVTDKDGGQGTATTTAT